MSGRYSDEEDGRDSRRRSKRSASRSRSRSRDRHADRHRSSRRRSGSPGSDQGARVHVGEIDASVTERDIEEAFGKYGQVGEVWLATYAPFFAFVVFKHRGDAEEAVRYINGTYIRNCKVRASIALPRRSFGGGGGGGRPRYGGYGGPPRYGGGYGGGGYGRRGDGGSYQRSRSRSPAYGRNKFSPRNGGGGGSRRRSRSGSRSRRRSPSYDRYSRSP